MALVVERGVNGPMAFDRNRTGGAVAPRLNPGWALKWLDDADGDMYLGMDNSSFPDFFVQKAVKAGSVATDNSETASNYYQGKWGSGASPSWPFFEFMYNVGGGAVGKYVTLGEDDTVYIKDGATTFGIYDGTYGGGGIVLGARIVGCGVYHYFDEGNNRYVIRTMSNGSKAAQQISQIALAGQRLTSFIPVTTDVVDFGNATFKWKSGTFKNDVQCRQIIADGDNAGVASTNSLTATSDLTANSTGVGTVLFKGTTNRNSSGFIKIYIGATAYYVPVFSAITG